MSLRIRLAGLAATCLAFLTPACSGPSGATPSSAAGAEAGGAAATCPLPPNGALAVATSRRANSATTMLPRVRGLVVDFIRGIPATAPGDPDPPPLILVNVDGAPTVYQRASFRSGARTGFALDYDRQTFLTSFDTALQNMRAVVPEVDDLEALTVAARVVRASGSGALVLADSGLSTRGWVNFAQPGGLLDAAPDEVVGYLRANGALPDLSGLTVYLALGETAPPQDALSGPYRKQVYAIWTAIAKSSAAACVAAIDDSAPPAPPLPGLPHVTKVETPAPPPPPIGCAVVLRDTGPIAFNPGSADFKEKDAAERELRGLGGQLVAQGCFVQLTGTTARHGDVSGQIDLGKDRAIAVRDILVADGVDPVRIRVRGVGSYFPQYVPDFGLHGELLPGPAQLNRTVRIEPCTPQCPS